MTIREGDQLEYDGERYRVLKVYSDYDLTQSSVLLQSMDKKKLMVIGMDSITRSDRHRSG